MDTGYSSFPYFMFGAVEGGVTGSYCRVRQTWAQTCAQKRVPMPPFFTIVRGGGPYAMAVSAFFGSSNLFNRWSREHYGQSPLASAVWSGLVGTACLNPLEGRIVCRVMGQPLRWMALVAGGMPAAIRNMLIAIGCYYMPTRREGASFSERAIDAMGTGFMVGAASHPADNVSTEMKKVAALTGKRPGVIRVVRQMIAERGWRSLVQGSVLRCVFRMPSCMLLMLFAREVEVRTCFPTHT